MTTPTPRAVMLHSCPWCHTLNPLDRPRCRECGHEAHTARGACQCDQCRALALPAARPIDARPLAPHTLDLFPEAIP